MSLVCGLELCFPCSAADGAKAYLFPCLLPAVSAEEVSSNWPVAIGAPNADRQLYFAGHRFKASEGFLPPGLFPVLLARMATRLPPSCIDVSRLWSNCAVLLFGEVVMLSNELSNSQTSHSLGIFFLLS